MPIRQALVAGFLPFHPIKPTWCTARVHRGLYSRDMYREHEEQDVDPEDLGFWSACKISHGMLPAGTAGQKASP